MMRTFRLTDDCTLSGRRLHRDERRVEGGGYVDLAGRSRPKGSKGAKCLWNVGGGGPLVPAHGVVVVRAAGMKTCPERRRGVGEVEVPPTP